MAYSAEKMQRAQRYATIRRGSFGVEQDTKDVKVSSPKLKTSSKDLFQAAASSPSPPPPHSPTAANYNSLPASPVSSPAPPGSPLTSLSMPGSPMVVSSQFSASPSSSTSSSPAGSPAFTQRQADQVSANRSVFRMFFREFVSVSTVLNDSLVETSDVAVCHLAWVQEKYDRRDDG